MFRVKDRAVLRGPGGPGFVLKRSYAFGRVWRGLGVFWRFRAVWGGFGRYWMDKDVFFPRPWGPGPPYAREEHSVRMFL